jgi:hypothetical protein
LRKDAPVQALITFFVELCLLRRVPQNLPSSWTLFQVTLVADLATGLLVGLAAGISAGLSLIQGGAEIALMLGALFVALRLTGREPRFAQSASALLGSSALIGLVALLPLGLSASGGQESDAAALGAFLLLGLVGWSILVTGHILRHTFDITLGQGTAAAAAFEILTIALLGGLFTGV